MTRLLAAALLLVAGCGAAPSASPSPVPSSPPPVPSTSPAAPTPPVTSAAPSVPVPETPAEMVQQADELHGVRVERSGDQLQIASLWGVGCDHDGCVPTVLVRQRGDRAPTYRIGTFDELSGAVDVAASRSGAVQTSEAPDPVWWVVTADQGLRVSTDGTTYREVSLRP